MNRDVPIPAYPPPAKRVRFVSSEEENNQSMNTYMPVPPFPEREPERLYASGPLMNMFEPIDYKADANALRTLELRQQNFFDMCEAELEEKPIENDENNDQLILDLQNELKVLEAQRRLLDEDIARTRLRIIIMHDGGGRSYAKTMI